MAILENIFEDIVFVATNCFNANFFAEWVEILYK